MNGALLVVLLCARIWLASLNRNVRDAKQYYNGDVKDTEEQVRACFDHVHRMHGGIVEIRPDKSGRMRVILED
jgi:hypothetical protein